MCKLRKMQNALKDIFGPMFEAMLQGEMNSHLGYQNNERGEKKKGRFCNRRQSSRNVCKRHESAQYRRYDRRYLTDDVDNLHSSHT